MTLRILCNFGFYLVLSYLAVIFKIMKIAGRFIAVLLLGFGVVQCFSAVAAEDAGNPYQTIIKRNIFGLLPIPVVDPASQLPPPEPPPKITPNGIMNIFGRLQVLFKVAVKPLPGQPAKDAAYVMSVGERQDDVAVVKIDQPDGIITFNNHGTIQELPLVATSASSGGMPSGGAIPATPGGMAKQSETRARGASASLLAAIGAQTSSSSRRGMNVNISGNNSTASTKSIANNTPVNASGIYSPAAGGIQEDGLTPEQNYILIEAQRNRYSQEGSQIANLLPTTPLTDKLNPDHANAGGTIPSGN